MRILVTGGSGQLGRELAKCQNEHPDWHFLFTDLPQADICNRRQIEGIVSGERIDTIVNCAAYTAVDRAESEPEQARMVNVEGPRILATVAAAHDSRLIHLSTDFVFDGGGTRPYVETDPTAPLCTYGLTKRDGESAVLAAHPASIIVRTSWLYSAHGGNFVKTMRRLGRERSQLRVVADQVGSPCWAADLARAVLRIAADPKAGTGVTGIFHYSNEGVASWYDFAREIMAASNLDCAVAPITTAEYPTPARRPRYSVMDKAKIRQTFGLVIPHWKDSLGKCIAELELLERPA